MQSDVLYERRQTGYVIVVALVIAMGLIVIAAAGSNSNTGIAFTGPLAIVLGVVAGIFSSMTVRVTTTTLEWWIGIRAIGRRVPITEIASIESIKTNIFEGWGIHLTWHGWVWNVSGFNAVQIRLKSGTRYAVGTPEPDKLIAAIREAQSGT